MSAAGMYFIQDVQLKQIRICSQKSTKISLGVFRLSNAMKNNYYNYDNNHDFDNFWSVYQKPDLFFVTKMDLNSHLYILIYLIST